MSEASKTTTPVVDPAETGVDPSGTGAGGGEPAKAGVDGRAKADSTQADSTQADTGQPVGKVKAGRFPLRLSRLTALAVAAALVVAVAAAATFGVLLQRKLATDRAAAEALATAKAYAVTVTSYDYQNLDRNFADVLDGATGEFKDQYAGASQTLRQLIAGAKATSKGTVLAAGVSSVNPDQVEVVVFVDQSITNAAVSQPRIDRNRMIMTLTSHDGRWLVSNLELR